MSRPSPYDQDMGAAPRDQLLSLVVVCALGLRRRGGVKGPYYWSAEADDWAKDGRTVSDRRLVAKAWRLWEAADIEGE